MNFIEDNVGNIIILSIIIVWLCLCIKNLVRERLSGKPSCACGRDCSTCGLCQIHELKEKKV